jgi:hypothetical protein
VLVTCCVTAGVVAGKEVCMAGVAVTKFVDWTLLTTLLGVGVDLMVRVVALVGVGRMDTVVVVVVAVSMIRPGVVLDVVGLVLAVLVGVGLSDVVEPLVEADGVSSCLAGVTLGVGVGRRLSVVPEDEGVWACLAGVTDEGFALVVGVWFCRAGLTMVVVDLAGVSLRTVVDCSRGSLAGVGVVVVVALVGVDLLGVVFCPLTVPAHAIHIRRRADADTRSRCKFNVISL